MSKTKNTILLLLIVFWCTAQQKTIIGNVVDSLSNGIDGAIVNCVSKSNQLLKTEITDTGGAFQLQLISSDSVRISISADGFETLLLPFFLSKDSLTNLNSLQLKSKLVNLTEIEVKSKLPFVERKIDRTVINPEAQISTAGLNAFDLLAKAPGVIISQNNQIKLKGKSGVIVSIDDKPIMLTGEDLENYLKTIPASSIRQIELIPNAPANYDAAGNAGLINLKSNRIKTAGWNGSLALNYGQGRYMRSNNNFSLNYANKFMSVFSGLNATSNNSYHDLRINRTYKDSLLNPKSTFNQNTMLKTNSNALNARIGADFYVNKKLTLGTNIKYLLNKTILPKYNFAEVFDYTTQIASNVIADNNDENVLNNASGNINARYAIDSLGKQLTLDADYVNYSVNYKQNFINSIIHSDGTILYNDTQFGNNKTNINLFSAKSDLNIPLKQNAKLDFGLKTALTETNNDAQYSITLNGITNPNYNLSNTFLYNELINAAYTNYSKSFSKIDIQLGLRFESTTMKGKQLGNPIIAASEFTRPYNNLFPTVFIMQKLDSVGNKVLSFNYSKRIDRPFFKDLNPFISPLDRFTFYSGNPFLAPSISHNLSLALALGTFFNTTFAYSYLDNQTKETIEINNGIYYSRPGNIGLSEVYNLSFDGQLQFKKWWTMNYYSEIVYAEYKSKLYTEILDSKGTYWYINLVNSFVINSTLSCEISGEYLTDVTETQFVIGDMGHMSCGLQKRLLKNKASIKLNVSDLLFTNKIRGTINNLQLTDAGWRSRRDTRVVNVTFSYRFGKNKAKKPQYQSNSADTELKRLKS